MSGIQEQPGTALIIELLSWAAATTLEFETAAALDGAAAAVCAGLGTEVDGIRPPA